jgi:hypothetical protein
LSAIPGLDEASAAAANCLASGAVTTKAETTRSTRVG